MIAQLLDTIKTELDEFISLKDPPMFGSQEICVVSNLVEQDGNLAFTSSSTSSDHIIVITVVNIEEERTFKDQVNYKKTDRDTIINVNPEIRINLSVLFTAYSASSYTTSLQILSYVIGFMQMKNVFTPQNSPSLNGVVEKATITLNTLSAEQNNHLWGYLGAKYMPSVVYKIKMLTIQEDHKMAEGPPITIIKENFEDKIV